MRICGRSNSADTKVSEEYGAGGAPGTRAGIPLQSKVKIMVRQPCPLQPMEEPQAGAGGCLKGGCDHCGKPMLEQAAGRDLQTYGERSSGWSRVGGGTCDPVGDPCRNSLLLKDCTLWKGSHTGALNEDLQPMGWTHIGEVHEELHERSPILEQRKNSCP